MSAPAPPDVELLSVRGNEAELRVGGRIVWIPFLAKGSEISFLYDGETYTVDVAGPGSKRRARQSEQSLAAPMPGLVLKVNVKPGDAVTKGLPLLVLEAMKMEHAIVAPYDGTVRSLNCKEGELVQPGVDLVTIDKAP